MARIQKENVSVPVVIQHVGGDLRARGRMSKTLIVEGDGNVNVEQIGDGQPYVMRCDGDCRVTLPQNVDLVIQQVGGDAKLTDLGGMSEINTIGGDLILRNVQAAQVKTVGGDMRVKWAAGPMVINTIGGDGMIREVDGDVTVDTVGADLFIRNIKGNCVVEQVGSDLVLSMDFVSWHEYRFGAGSDILCRVHPDTNARIIVPAETTIDLDIDAEITEDDDGNQIVTLGDGSATIVIEAANELRLVGEGEDYGFDLGIQIEEDLEARMMSLEEKLSQQLEGLDERIQAKADLFASQAERFSEHAQQQARRAAERFRRSMERQRPRRKHRSGSRFEFSWGTPPPPPAPPKPPAEPVSEQERLMILQMVQENKITIEEAERLLAALESQD